MSIVVGIDPGLANTAIVVVVDGHITGARTVTTKGSGTPDFPTVMERGSRICAEVERVMADLWNVEAVAIEGYEDFGGGHLRNRNGRPIPNRWTTPAVCALIGARLGSLGYTVVWQRPSVVMARYAAHKRFWADGKSGLVSGDERLTNDHLRSAAAHALAYIDGHHARKRGDKGVGTDGAGHAGDEAARQTAGEAAGAAPSVPGRGA